jgi:hypothetical protein
MLSGHPQLEQCQIPLIIFRRCPSARVSGSLPRFDTDAWAGAGTTVLVGGGGGSFSSGAGSFETSAAVEGIGARIFARGRNTAASYAGALKKPFTVFSLITSGGGSGTGGRDDAVMRSPFSDATMFAMVTEAAAAAARRDMGAVAAAAAASVAASGSGNPMEGVR